jgi:pilus assembly protein CpaC
MISTVFSVLNRLGSLVLALGLALGLTGAALAQDQTIRLDGARLKPVEIAVGFTLSIKTDRPFVDVVVGDAKIADAFPLADNTLYIQGKAIGATNLTFYDAEHQPLGVLVVRVDVDFGDLQDAIDKALPSAQIDVGSANGRVRLTGVVRDKADMERAIDIASQYADTPVVNAMRTGAPEQIQLEVRILEVSRNAGAELGVSLNGRGVTTEGSTEQPFGSFVGSLLQGAGRDIDVVINTLETRGLARRLANPTLVTSNGVEANFVVGGEVPISASYQGDNGSVATQTDYREYGVRLNFKPDLQDNGIISLRIRPEVSDIDDSVDVNGQPGFITRKADTTVSLRDGQSFAIAGLLQVTNERRLRQVPGLGEVPILGALFRSSGFQKNETDLVIVVTPRLVSPGAAGTEPVSPMDTTEPSSGVELFMLGMLETDRSMIRAFETGEGIMGPFGHMLDLTGN